MKECCIFLIVCLLCFGLAYTSKAESTVVPDTYVAAPEKQTDMTGKDVYAIIGLRNLNNIILTISVSVYSTDNIMKFLYRSGRINPEHVIEYKLLRNNLNMSLISIYNDLKHNNVTHVQNDMNAMLDMFDMFLSDNKKFLDLYSGKIKRLPTTKESFPSQDT